MHNKIPALQESNKMHVDGIIKSAATTVQRPLFTFRLPHTHIVLGTGLDRAPSTSTHPGPAGRVTDQCFGDRWLGLGLSSAPSRSDVLGRGPLL